MSGTIIKADELRAMNPTQRPDFAKDFSRYSFWQYTRLDLVDLILSSSTFRISNLNGMNDLDEAKLHEKDRTKVFALCFCNSDTEKIPLWYLYSGMAGKGAAIGFTPATMLKWLKSIKNVKAIKAGQKKEEGDLLEVGKDVKLQFGWVYYQKQHEPENIFYRNKWYAVDDISAFQKGNYFIKYYPWEYEREFRLVFHTKKPYDAIYVEIPKEVNNAAKVRLAPELKKKQLSKSKSLKCIGHTHEPLESELTIRMNLFSRNRNGYLDYLREELVLAKPAIEAHDICDVIQGAGLCKKP